MKLNRTRSVTSLQPDKRNGHRPAIVVQFWGDKSVALRHTERGPGKKPPELPIPPVKRLWFEDLHAIDEVTLKEIKPTIKWTPPPMPGKPKLNLAGLMKAFENRRTR